MGKQSARIYYQGKDHRDIYYDGHYHDAMYLGSQLLWKKVAGGTFSYIEVSKPLSYITYGNGVFAAASGSIMCVSNDGLNYTETAHLPGNINQMMYYGGYLYAVDSDSVGSFLYKSADTVSWEQVNAILSNLSGTAQIQYFRSCKISIANGKMILATGTTTEIGLREVSLYPNTGYYAIYTTTDMGTLVAQNILTRPRGSGILCRIASNISAGGIAFINGSYYFDGARVTKPVDKMSTTEVKFERGYIKTSNFIDCTVIPKDYTVRSFGSNFMLCTKNNSVYISYDLNTFIDITCETMYESLLSADLLCENNRYYAIRVQSGRMTYSVYIFRKSDNSLYTQVNGAGDYLFNSFIFGDMSNTIFSFFGSCSKNGSTKYYIFSLELEE